MKPAKPNAKRRGQGQVDLLRCDVAALGTQTRLRADTVVMNPPFGTRQSGVDISFLRAAFRVRERQHSWPLSLRTTCASQAGRTVS